MEIELVMGQVALVPVGVSRGLWRAASIRPEGREATKGAGGRLDDTPAEANL